MKNLLALSLLALTSPSAFAAPAPVIKTCSAELRFPDSVPVLTVIYVLKDGDAFRAQTKQTKNGFSHVFEQSVEISEHSIREGLSADSDPYKTTFNEGEGYIAHAMSLSAHEDMKEFFSTGLDLAKVRLVKVYGLGKLTNMGRMVIVEARDASGIYMGSFLGGMLVAPCR